MITAKEIEKILRESFQIHEIRVIDESHKHAGHAESIKRGGGHFNVYIISDDFTGKPLLARHRMVQNVLKSQLKKDIHALSIKALTAEEASSS